MPQNGKFTDEARIRSVVAGDSGTDSSAIERLKAAAAHFNIVLPVQNKDGAAIGNSALLDAQRICDAWSAATNMKDPADRLGIAASGKDNNIDPSATPPDPRCQAGAGLLLGALLTFPLSVAR